MVSKVFMFLPLFIFVFAIYELLLLNDVDTSVLPPYVYFYIMLITLCCILPTDIPRL